MKPPTDLPSWLQDDDIDSDTLLEVTMDDGSRFTGTLRNISDDWERVEWEVRPSRTIVVPIRSVVSATPVTEPLSDPHLPPASLERKPLNPSTLSLQSGLLFGTAIAVALGISTSRDWWWPAHWQVVAAVAYTMAILVGTFASVRYGAVLPEIAFTRPEVRRRLPRLALIHIGFLVAWLVLASVAIAIQPALPAWCNATFGSRGGTPFTFAIGILFFASVGRQVSINRGLLE